MEIKYLAPKLLIWIKEETIKAITKYVEVNNKEHNIKWPKKCLEIYIFKNIYISEKKKSLKFPKQSI